MSENSEEDSPISDEEEENSDATPIFYCPANKCTKQFRKYGNLHNHIATGKHHMKLERMTLLNRNKLLYKESLESVQDQPLPWLPFQFRVLKYTSRKLKTTQLKQN